MADNVSIQFTESPAEEIQRIQEEFGYAEILASLKTKNFSSIPQDRLREMLLRLSELLNFDLPEVIGTPEDTLLAVSQDINMGRILRERGIFRLYRLVNERDAEGLPLFMSLIDPVTGAPFRTQNDFLKWFCEEAHVARSLVFLRKRAIDRLLDLGLDLEKAYNLLVTKPSTIASTLDMVGEWDSKGQLIGMEPDVALTLINKVAPEQAEKFAELVDRFQETGKPEDYAAYIGALKPAVLRLTEEVSLHASGKDSMDFVRHDILQRPEIEYTYDAETDSIVVEYVIKSTDLSGSSYERERRKIRFASDASGAVPESVRSDIINRLPIRNRRDFDM